MPIKRRILMKALPSMLWYDEIGSWDEQHKYVINEVLFWEETKFQDVAIFVTEEYGKMLVTDGSTQSAEEDEYIYHESIVHPGLIAHPGPHRVLVIGGGEGAVIREVFRHPTIERVVMVDIDAELVEQCKKFLPEWHQGAFQDPRLELVFADGKDFIAKTKERFDCIIVDCGDAREEGPALTLYTEDFYRTARQRLTASGLLVVQAMELSGLDCANHVTIHKALQRIFRHVNSYAAFVPSFWATWGFIVANDTVDVSQIPSREVDKILQARKLAPVLRYYDGLRHSHMFTLPKDVKAGSRG